MTCILAATMRPHRRVCLALALAPLLFPVGSASAQEGVRVDPGPIWTARTENDKFSTVPGGTDRYYTAGNQVAYTSSPNQVPQAASDFGRFLFGGGTTWLGVSVGQQIYTPANTRLIQPDPNDRPYAGYLAATVSLIQDVENTRNVVGMSLGVIGPSAGGRLIQNGFHALINTEPAHGWSAQLHDEPALQFSASRTWRKQLVSLGPVETDVLPAVALGVGTVRDYVQAGARLRIGHGLDRDFGPARITQGLDGGDAYLPGDGLGYYAFIGVSSQAIARDAFLDGTLTGRSPHVSRRPLMADAEGGVAVLWRGTRISYTHTWQTDAFRGQKAGLFNFGSIALSTRF
jgi:lipid A 3-O-deacylase